ncbi:MAG: hypothetical protein ACK56I_00190 [bacterium]
MHNESSSQVSGGATNAAAKSRWASTGMSGSGGLPPFRSSSEDP